MTRTALIFLLAVLLPSVILAVLAWRSLRDQRYVLERQQAEWYQSYTDSLAERLRKRMEQQQLFFASEVEELLSDRKLTDVAADFDLEIRDAWPMAMVGFAVTLDGTLLAPAPYDDELARNFRADNRAFLTNLRPEAAYNASNLDLGLFNQQFAKSASDRAHGAEEKHGPGTDLVTGSMIDEEGGNRIPVVKEEKQPTEFEEEAWNDSRASQNNSLDTPRRARREKETAGFVTAREESKGGAQSLRAAPRATAGEEAKTLEDEIAEGLKTETHRRIDSPITRDQTRSNVMEMPLEQVESRFPASGVEPKRATPDLEKVREKQGALAYNASESAPIAQEPTRPPQVLQSAPSSEVSRATAGSAFRASNRQDIALVEPLRQVELKRVPGKNKPEYSKSKMIYRSQRSVMPQQVTVTRQALAQAENPPSKSRPEQTEFRDLVTSETSGSLARFLQDQLTLLVWYRSPRDPQIVFGAQLNLDRVKKLLAGEVQPVGEVGVALLDDSGQPVARAYAPLAEGTLAKKAPQSFTANWKRPFVATEVGDVLPHWEVAVYMLPDQLARAVGRVQFTIGSAIGLLVLAIGLGGWLMIADVRRQFILARQKTDFVSNVSHELKTPLTSIRMFSELLTNNEVESPEQRRIYLNIIATESARLTRLINNVLDFARIERREKKYNFASLNMVEVAREAVENFSPQVENHGFELTVDLTDEYLPIRGDRDALAQVVLNLLSNAEKYGGDARQIQMNARLDKKRASALLEVVDHGPGVPRGCDKKIFEKFYRAHDSLDSGIQGSGLGLTLSRQIAEAHEGSLTYARRGGVSVFTLSLPLAERHRG